MTQPNKETATPFAQEDRYFKVKDAKEFLGLKDYCTLIEIGERVTRGRATAKKAELRGVVVETDWPEYEPTWASLEARMTGKPSPQASSLEELRGALREAADELSNTLFRFDTVVEALRQAVITGGKPLTAEQADTAAAQMLHLALPAREILHKLNALLTPPPPSAD